MRSGRLQCADSLSRRIGKRITRCNANCVSNKNLTSRELWGNVRKLMGKELSGEGQDSNTFTATMLNDHYAKISTDPRYACQWLKYTASQQRDFLLGVPSFPHTRSKLTFPSPHPTKKLIESEIIVRTSIFGLGGSNPHLHPCACLVNEKPAGVRVGLPGVPYFMGRPIFGYGVCLSTLCFPPLLPSRNSCLGWRVGKRYKHCWVQRTNSLLFI